MLELIRSVVPAEDASKREEQEAGWLEIYGETEPTVSSGTGAPSEKGADLYEYRWAMGLLAPLPLSSHLPQGRSSHWTGHADSGQQGSGRFADPAAHVYLLFAADCNWRVSEFLATVKHLAPVQDERTWGEELAKDFTAIQPVIGAAGQIAATAAGMPELGSIAATVTRLKLTSVPPTQSSEWFVRRVDAVTKERLYHGVEWQLSLSLLNQMGSRVTGGLLVSFDSVEAEGATSTDQSRALLANAVFHYVQSGDSAKDIWIPAKDEFLSLSLAPAPNDAPGSN